MNDSTWISVWRVGIAILIGLISSLILNFSIKGIDNRLKKTGEDEERYKRLKTLLKAWRSIGHVIIALITILMVLNELGVNIAPILASAGVVGLGFSLGAQTIIKDYLGGIIILTENQFAVGDVITLEDITGTVERVTLRATYVRDIEGKLNIIPNGDIRTVSNLTTKWAQAVVTFNFEYDADINLVLQTLNKSANLAQSDPEKGQFILESPRVLGWTKFTDWSVQAQIFCKTHPGEQWQVARLLRKTALECLKKEGIHQAVPRQRIETIKVNE